MAEAPGFNQRVSKSDQKTPHTVFDRVPFPADRWSGVFCAFIFSPEPPQSFDGGRALADVATQVAFGPRTPGSDGHARVQEWLRAQLSDAGWEARVQSAEVLGHPVENIIAYRGDEQPEVILGAHYDTRMRADQDPDPARQMEPVPGANDGASGVAVLLELARVLPADSAPVWLVFFDAEDNGRIQGWDWILGSRAFVEQLAFQPEAAVVVDMIGDADQNIYIERNSNPELSQEIWGIAAASGLRAVFHRRAEVFDAR